MATGELSARSWRCYTHCPTMTMLGKLIQSDCIAERPWRVKNLHHSSLWITVPLLSTGVCNSCWYSLWSSNPPGFIRQVKWLFRNMESSARISSIKHVLTGAGDIAKALREDWREDTWLSMPQHCEKKSWHIAKRMWINRFESVQMLACLSGLARLL